MGWTCIRDKCNVLSFVINSGDFPPGSASGRAFITVRRPAKVKPVSFWWKLAAQVCSRCILRWWFACGKDNTNSPYSVRSALHPSPNSAVMRAGIWQPCPHTQVVSSTSVHQTDLCFVICRICSQVVFITSSNLTNNPFSFLFFITIISPNNLFSRNKNNI